MEKAALLLIFVLINLCLCQSDKIGVLKVIVPLHICSDIVTLLANVEILMFWGVLVCNLGSSISS